MYQGERSESKSMPGGGPQKNILGLFIFLIKIYDAEFKDKNPTLGELITKNVNKGKSVNVVFTNLLTSMKEQSTKLSLNQVK